MNSVVSMLVNNAGSGSIRTAISSQVDDMENIIELNVTALTRLTLSALPAFLARKSGAIINIASIVSLTPELLNGVYNASKAYVVSFTQSLHKELKTFYLYQNLSFHGFWLMNCLRAAKRDQLQDTYQVWPIL